MLALFQLISKSCGAKHSTKNLVDAKKKNLLIDPPHGMIQGRSYKQCQANLQRAIYSLLWLRATFSTEMKEEKSICKAFNTH
jgi:hypothetical protein